MKDEKLTAVGFRTWIESELQSFCDRHSKVLDVKSRKPHAQSLFKWLVDFLTDRELLQPLLVTLLRKEKRA